MSNAPVGRHTAHMSLADVAVACHRAGLCVLPAYAHEKRPVGAWDGKNLVRPSESETLKMFRPGHSRFRHDNRLFLVCGTVSDGVECLDFDDGGSAFEAWAGRIPAELFARLVIERSPSGGFHVVYRCPQVLAPKTCVLARAGHGGKLIETRGEGAGFICAPSPGYELIQGDFTRLPDLAPEGRDILLNAARALDCPVERPTASVVVATASPVWPVVSGNASRYALKALEDECAKVACAPEGMRNSTLNIAAVKIGHYIAGGQLPENDTRAALSAAAHAAGLAPGEIAATLSSGFRKGMAEPKGIPADDYGGVNLSGVLDRLERVASEPNHDPPMNSVPLSTSTALIKAPSAETMVVPALHGSQPPGWRIALMSEYPPRIVRWLWPGHIARGALNMLVGDAGLGKSFITCDLAARVSSGRSWPDGQPNSGPGRVFMLNDEDDVYTTIRPRLEAAGADCRLIHTKPEEIAGKSVSIVRDLAELERFALAIPGMKLVIIDPIAAYLGGKDSHNNAEVREALAPLASLAHKYDVAVLVVSHLRKNGGPAKDRVTGSGAFVAAARSVWAVAEDPDDPKDKPRLFVPVKNNLGPDRFGLTYRINPESGYRVEENGYFGDPIPVVAWGAAIDRTADEALRKQDDRCPSPRRSQTAATDEWLEAFLADGERPASEVYEAGVAAGFSEDQLKRSRPRIGALIRRVGMPSKSYWRLPGPRGAPASCHETDAACAFSAMS